MQKRYKFVSSDKENNGTETINRIINQALNYADPKTAVLKKVSYKENKLIVGDRDYFIQDTTRVYIIGLGKGVYPMYLALEEILGNVISESRIIVKHVPEEQKHELNSLTILQGSHPVPDQKSIDSAIQMSALLDDLTPEDIVICLITGGGSSLMTLPQPGISLQNMQELTGLLLSCGAEIQEMNIIRKHLDQLKGGGLARKAYPAKLITLILSDIIGNPLDMIASGPTTGDDSTFADAIAILKKYDLEKDCPAEIMNLFITGEKGETDETVKSGNELLSQVNNVLVTSNEEVLIDTKTFAEDLGFNAMVLTSYLHGEASQAGQFLGSILKQIAKEGIPLQRPACVLVGGETTVTIKGNGLGGRNQELVLGAVDEISGLKDVYLLSLATDGDDGPTDAAGAVIDGNSYIKGKELGLSLQEFLTKNDSYHYFEKTNELIMIGPTGTNVNDIMFLFAI